MLPYRVIQRLIQHCLLSKIVYLNLKFVLLLEAMNFYIYTQNHIGNITLSRVIISAV